MDSASPYQPPLAGPPPVPSSENLVPGSVKAFGIMHLILAGMGLLGACFSAATLVMGPLFIPHTHPTYQAQLQFQAETRWATMFGLLVNLSLTGLLLAAGIKLAKSQPDGVKWSARYSWTSIATKLVLMAVGAIWILPATRKLMHASFNVHARPGSPGSNAMLPFVDLMASASVVISPLISCVYPALALYFLSRPMVKAWRAAARPGAF
ncbi:hypothetical protein [Haloferula sp. BvORR071]|uniref:hypothetical protein n=1 Tax=Haloferula sp. BvORR071 TaxID=1396141 RepID=UPI00054F3036|nr:hypothetical protein [Haloferula sp. BvORR071]